MSSSKPRQYSCIGTNRISIMEDSQSASDGMISLFQRSKVYEDGAHRLSDGSTESNNCLHLMITDGVDTFYSLIKQHDVKQISRENDKSPLDQVANILLYKHEESGDFSQQQEQDKYKISYKRAEGQLLGGDHDSTNTTSIKTSILKTCFNNLVRPVWEGAVNNIHHAKYDRLPSFVQSALQDPTDEKSTTSFSSSGLAFPLMLGNTISKLQTEAESLRNQNQQLTTDALRWKGTLDKLMGQWQSEKIELTQNFLTLFNQHKARHMETRQQLDALSKHNTNDNAAVGILSNKKLRRNEREAVPDDEDNHDYAVWDNEMVDRLAAGPGARKKMTEQNLKVDDNIDESCAPSGDTFRNPHTGVLEISNYKRVFDSDDEKEDESSKKQKG